MSSEKSVVDATLPADGDKKSPPGTGNGGGGRKKRKRNRGNREERMEVDVAPSQQKTPPEPPNKVRAVAQKTDRAQKSKAQKPGKSDVAVISAVKLLDVVRFSQRKASFVPSRLRKLADEAERQLEAKNAKRQKAEKSDREGESLPQSQPASVGAVGTSQLESIRTEIQAAILEFAPLIVNAVKEHSRAPPPGLDQPGGSQKGD